MPTAVCHFSLFIEQYFLQTLIYGTGLPHYNAIFGVHRKDCVISETVL